jgi:hypothetical protein
MQGTLSAWGSQGLSLGTPGLTGRHFLAVMEGHTGSCSLSPALCARDRGYIRQGSQSCHPNQSLALTPDSHSIKLLRANSCGQAACLSSQLPQAEGTRSQVFPGDPNLQCLGHECPLMSCPLSAGSVRIWNLPEPRVLPMSDRGHQAAHFRTPCWPPTLPCLLIWFPRSSQGYHMRSSQPAHPPPKKKKRERQ